MNNKSNIYDRKCIKLIYNRFFHIPRYNLRFNGYKPIPSRMISIELHLHDARVWKLLGNFPGKLMITIIEPNYMCKLDRYIFALKLALAKL